MGVVTVKWMGGNFPERLAMNPARMLVLFSLVLVPAAAQAQNIIINEVFYDSPGADTGTFVELKGPAGTSLNGYSIEAFGGDGASISTIALDGSVIPASGYFVVGQSSGVQNVNLVSAKTDYVNTAASLVLRQGASTVDAMGYGVFSNSANFKGEGSPARGGSGFSTGRMDDGTDTGNNRNDFDVLAVISPGASNGGHSAGSPPANVLINEIHANGPGDDGSQEREFIEIAGPAGTSLSGLHLLGTEGNGGDGYKYIALTGSIPASGLYVVGDGAAVTNVNQVSPDADLSNGPHNVLLRWGKQVVDAVGYGSFGASDVFDGTGTAVAAPAEGRSIGRIPDGKNTNNNSADFAALNPPTPGMKYVEPDAGTDAGADSGDDAGDSGAATGADSGAPDTGADGGSDAGVTDTGSDAGTVDGPVIINEALYDEQGSETSSTTAFVELKGPAGLSLSNYKLLLINGANGQVYATIQLTGVIPASGYFVIGEASVASRNQNLSVDIQNGPDNVVLLKDNTTIDAVGYGSFGSGETFSGEGRAAPNAADGKSIARTPDGADSNDNGRDFAVESSPTPGAPNRASQPPADAGADAGSGDGASDTGATDTGSADAGTSDTGTDAGAGPPPFTLIINEALYDEVGDDASGQNSFIELKGPADSDVTGFQIALVNGADGKTYAAIALAGKTNASGYYVLGESGIADARQALLVDIQNGPDNIQLVYGGKVVDALGYGNFDSGDFFRGEGSEAAAPPSGKTAARLPDGTDSNNNKNDFKVGRPTPNKANEADGSPADAGVADAQDAGDAAADAATDAGQPDAADAGDGGVTPPAPIVINEAFVNPKGSDVNCFVELKGPPGTDLTGYTLFGVDGSNGQSYNEISLDEIVIPDNGYLVVGQSANVPNVDVVKGDVNFQNGPDNILLARGSVIVDALGYGDFSKAEFRGEGQPAPAVDGLSLARSPDGADTNNNKADFIAEEKPTPGERNRGGPVADGGVDAGADASTDASSDAGDAAQDGGTDAGSDAGSDAGPGGGPGDSAGGDSSADAGDSGAAGPPLVFLDPDGRGDTADDIFTLRWTDGDNDDGSSINFFYDTDNQGFDGKPINSQPIPRKDPGNNFVWKTTDLRNGQYFVYGVISGGGAAEHRVYAGFPVEVKHGGEGRNTAPSLRITRPSSGVDAAGADYVIMWTDDDPDDNASIALYYTLDANDLGTPIISGLPEDNEDDRYVWNISGVSPGEYLIRAVINDGINRPVVVLSQGRVAVGGNAGRADGGLSFDAGGGGDDGKGCSCSTAPRAPANSGAALLLGLAAAVVFFRRRR
ncbi:MAG: hypothetical protein GMKNLPBB_02187 [Myxococcota bacterium]|nr:hypothetical protein [Myxococcota bacterium]